MTPSVFITQHPGPPECCWHPGYRNVGECWTLAWGPMVGCSQTFGAAVPPTLETKALTLQQSMALGFGDRKKNQRMKERSIYEQTNDL